jgi:hypothetical protein
MIGLTLTEDVRVLLIRCLRWRHPLQGGALVGCCEGNFNLDGLALRYSRRQRNGERATVGLYAVSAGKLCTLAVDFDFRYVNVAICVLI